MNKKAVAGVARVINSRNTKLVAWTNPNSPTEFYFWIQDQNKSNSLLFQYFIMCGKPTLIPRFAYG
jgi:hypothetical protein